MSLLGVTWWPRGAVAGALWVPAIVWLRWWQQRPQLHDNYDSSSVARVMAMSCERWQLWLENSRSTEIADFVGVRVREFIQNSLFELHQNERKKCFKWCIFNLIKTVSLNLRRELGFKSEAVAFSYFDAGEKRDKNYILLYKYKI